MPLYASRRSTEDVCGCDWWSVGGSDYGKPWLQALVQRRAENYGYKRRLLTYASPETLSAPVDK